MNNVKYVKDGKIAIKKVYQKKGAIESKRRYGFIVQGLPSVAVMDKQMLRQGFARAA